MNSIQLILHWRGKTKMLTKKKFLFIALAVCAVLKPSFGQELRSYYITCDSAEFAYLITHPEENEYIDCIFEYEGEVWEDTRIRLRGEDAMYYPKKSFKVNFPAENRFYGRDKINLKAQWNDPSFSREYLAYDLYQRAGLTASGTWFSRLYVNDDYMGLYLDVEQVDEHFLEPHGLDEGSTIYKAGEIGCLLTPTEPVEEIWKKKTNEATGYYDLYNLIEWLDTTPYEVFPQELSEYFQLMETMRAIAANALLGNKSTYYQNYYLIHDLNQGGYWRYIPWDMDNTFIYSADYDEPQYYRSGHESLSDLNALVYRCWDNNDTRDSIFQHIDGLMDSLFTESYYQGITNNLSGLLYQAVAEDTFKQFTTEDFLAALGQIPGDAANRCANMEYRKLYEPLPFDLNPAFITPTAVYFSWGATRIANGSIVTYEVEIADDPDFTTNVITLNASTNDWLYHSDIQPGQYYWRVFAYSPLNDDVRSLTFYSELNVPEGAFTGTEVTGIIENPTTWDITGSPYSLPEGLTIAEGAVLTIEPGVLVGIGTQQSIFVEGGINAIGTVVDSIHFVPLNPTPDPDSNWGAIIVTSTTDETNMAYVSIIRGSNGPIIPASAAMIKILGGQFSIFDSELSWGESGAIVSYSASIHVERVIFEHFGRHMVLAGGQSAVVRSCRFTLKPVAPVYMGLVEFNSISGYGEVSRCEFFACEDDAIDSDWSNNIEISRNYITDAGDKGISIGENCDNFSITNNIIIDCQIGIGIYTSANVELYNNLVSLNTEGLSVSHPGGAGEAVMRNTICWQNGVNIMPPPPGFLTVEYSLVGGAEPWPGQGNINSDPNFIDQWNENFYPQSNSPLIDAGFGTGHPEFDFNDSARVDILTIPNTGAGEIDYVDIGVYEYSEYSAGVFPQPPVPESHILLSNYPNPFNDVTRINFAIPFSGKVEITIYDLLGRRVFTRKFENLAPGENSLLWNGRNESGVQLTSGVYFCRMKGENFNRTIKLLMLK